MTAIPYGRQKKQSFCMTPNPVVRRPRNRAKMEGVSVSRAASGILAGYFRGGG